MSALVEERQDGHVRVLTIDNPPVNAFHPDVGEALIGAIDRVAAEGPRVRAVVLTGAGRYFMAGGDIRHFQTLNDVSAGRYARRIQIVQEAIQHLHCPVIAAVGGAALGGGCELMMACDIRVVGESAMFGQPEVSLGIIPGAGGTQNLPRLIPTGAAKRLLFTGDRIDAAEALRLGLVDEVVSDADLMPHALALADRIARNAPLAVSAAKKAVNLGLELGLAEALRLETALFAELFRSADVHEGVAAFLSKRRPDFQGK